VLLLCVNVMCILIRICLENEKSKPVVVSGQHSLQIWFDLVTEEMGKLWEMLPTSRARFAIFGNWEGWLKGPLCKLQIFIFNLHGKLVTLSFLRFRIWQIQRWSRLAKDHAKFGIIWFFSILSPTASSPTIFMVQFLWIE